MPSAPRAWPHRRARRARNHCQVPGRFPADGHRTSPIPGSKLERVAPWCSAPFRSSFPGKYQAVVPHPANLGYGPWATDSRNRPVGRPRPNPVGWYLPDPLILLQKNGCSPSPARRAIFPPLQPHQSDQNAARTWPDFDRGRGRVAHRGRGPATHLRRGGHRRATRAGHGAHRGSGSICTAFF